MILPPMGAPGKCPAHRRPWTAEEDELLISLHGKKTIAEMVKLLPAPGRSFYAVQIRIRGLRERFPELIDYVSLPWTQEHDNFLRKNRHTMTAKEIGNRLTPRRTEASVTLRAFRLGISLYKCGDNLPITRHKDEDVILIRELYDSSDLSFKKIGRKFDISESMTAWLYHHRHTAIDAIAREYLPR
ncbi:AsnC family protein [Salmonella enterica]|uniref:AsnC family protein n=1 Tax=Salmonella enterica I TaxID=59201 RepID=A0A5U3F1W1_SALET|nr:AsnC family protein [Salmonella enterica subsp. enterica]EBP4001972.1 AsnC family protein [Salmonella enterica subsp. enterica]ECJ0319931.1 AsnC family protein [Salmonella enterica]EIT2254822.1 Myb-like DNA-binding domain-containing protein [Salmonella enterica]EJD7999830.1 Myb-like DNA-binding domain-containing protein [Salmonella enterica]